LGSPSCEASFCKQCSHTYKSNLLTRFKVYRGVHCTVYKKISVHFHTGKLIYFHWNILLNSFESGPQKDLGFDPRTSNVNNNEMKAQTFRH
jgi:hypothetical protein